MFFTRSIFKNIRYVFEFFFLFFHKVKTRTISVSESISSFLYYYFIYHLTPSLPPDFSLIYPSSDI